MIVVTGSLILAEENMWPQTIFSTEHVGEQDVAFEKHSSGNCLFYNSWLRSNCHEVAYLGCSAFGPLLNLSFPENVLVVRALH